MSRTGYATLAMRLAAASVHFRRAAASAHLGRVAAATTLRLSPAACSSAVSGRGLSSYVDPRDTAEGKRRKRQSNFWRQWGERSQQDFWQDVGFGHDREKDEVRSGVKSIKERKGKAKGKGRPLELKEESESRDKLEEDEYWDSVDALDQDGRGFEALDEAAERHKWGTSSAGSKAGARRVSRARAALLQDEEISPSRRAELMTMLEDAGPEGLLPPPTMPEERWLRDKEEGTFKLQEDLSRNLVTTRCYSDTVTLRENNMMPEGSYFSYLLNTRRVTKVTAEGKRMSYSCLVVVGNGQGTAGVGMGKDAVAGNAMYKATVDARKNLTFIDRFDSRTLWHAIDDRFARTKVVLRMRRPGSGTRCSWAVWKILSAFGITDCSVRIYGSKNPTTVAYATVNALRRMLTAQDAAERRGIRVLDMDPADIRYPGYDGVGPNRP